MVSSIGLVIRTLALGLLASDSQLGSSNACLREVTPDRAERPIHTVIDCFRVGVSEDARHLICRHFINDVELDCEPILGRESLERASEQYALFGCHGRIGWSVGSSGRGLCELSGYVAARPPTDRTICAAQLAEKLTEREVGCLPGPE